MKINWITRETSWAFRYVCEHIIKKLTKHIHVFDFKENCDIKYVCSPNFFKHIKADSKTILHVDSNRWYEVFLNENKF
jgi:hypothetical protein